MTKTHHLLIGLVVGAGAYYVYTTKIKSGA